MPFTDPVSSVSGRNSRASNVSGVTVASRSLRSQPVPDTMASAGVLSMLKTSTDTGDIGALSFNHSRLPGMPRATHQRRDRNPRHSGGGSSNPAGGASSHHHYAPSQTSRVSSTREWDASSNQRRGSLTSMQSMPTSLPPVHLGKGQLQMPPLPPEGAGDSRSYSMTSAPPTQQLPRHRSAASLKSQGHEPRHPGQHRPGHQAPPMPENRPPYVYPTRLKRPGYRSPSPALSDTYAQGQPPPPQQAPPPGARRMPMPRPQPQTFNSDYGTDYNNDPRHLNVRPPPRAMSNSPVMGYGEPHAQYPYRNPAAMRSAPGLQMSPPPPQGLNHPPGPPHPHQPQQHPGQPPHMMHRGPFPGPSYQQRGGYPPYPPAQYPGQRGPPPPPPNAAPMAHHMFHNAARMARQLPQRTDTPLTNPSSSDPPSSGTAPTSSSPPTPKDQTTIQVAVDPAFIDPALVDLPDSSSEPVLAHQYLRYAEGLEKDVDEPEIEAAHPSVPPSGFVQRVRAMLESKAAAEAAAAKEEEREKFGYERPLHDDIAELDMEDDEELHELAANETPRFTIIEEFEAPVELPASPVRIAELGGSPVQHKRRITRDLVKAGLRPSSMEDIDDTETSENASIDVIVGHKPGGSRGTAKDMHAVVEAKAATEQVPSTPGAAEAHHHEDAKSETASTPAALGLSAADYALRWESTEEAEETQTKDPFVLDADTITLQHQRGKENVDLVEPSPEVKKHKATETEREFETPVSPILSGEDVSRCSAVSPLQTQTLGIDETLRMASAPAQDDSTASEEPTVPGAFHEESMPPPTPKTPKTYSKSVQLQPATTVSTDTPSSNRYSLPPDLSTVGDTTMNTNSDMITDVAVRFSLPQTTITVSKPQIIEIPPSSSPVREEPASKLPKPALHATDSKSKRGSVTFADEVVAPLKINKKLEQHPSIHRTGEPGLSKGKSIVRRPSPAQQEPFEHARASRENTTDLRFSGINGINNRFGSTHLPGLKEESISEMSISDKRASDKHGGREFPLPARIAAVKAMQERRLHESAEKAKARRAARHPNRPLADIRDLPSLNFSRMDLIDKLNEALEVRSSRSMDVIRRREFSGIYCPSPQRPQSTEPLRDRYTSFFSKPEDFSSFFDDPEVSEDEDETEEIEPSPEQAVPTVEIEPDTELAMVEPGSRPLSPEDLMNVATQVNRLSIPSVSGLSDRLSGILPNLRELQLDSILSNFAPGADDLRVLGDGRETVLSTRTSAGFRTLAERAEEIVKNGTLDSTVPIAKLLANNNKELPPLPESLSADKVSAVNSSDGKQSYLSGSVSAPSQLGKDIPVRPASALARTKSPMTEDEVRKLLPPEMNPITRHQKRAMIISSGSSRPWNQDENYPWAGTKVDVDLTVPSQVLIRDSTTGEVLLERGTKSLDLTNTVDPTSTTKGIDIGSILEHNPTATLTDEQLIGISPHKHLRKHSKRSVIGSLTRKIGLSVKGEGGCTTRSIPSPALPSEVGRSRSCQPHRPGERYPTSSLTPPVAFNLDEVRSFFSDDSSEKERNASFRKRLTHFKGKNRSQHSRSHSGIPDADTAYDPGELLAAGERANSSANTFDGVGMGKAEFRIKRFGEKLRLLMARGGELIRTWSQRSGRQPGTVRGERARDDWLSDSLYSGV